MDASTTNELVDNWLISWCVQLPIIINYFRKLSINQQVKMSDPVLNYVLTPFEGNIITEYPQWIKIYL